MTPRRLRGGNETGRDSVIRALVLFVATIFAASTTAAQLLADGKPPVGHWLGSPEGGDTAADATVSGSHGTISAGKGGRSDRGPFKAAFAFEESHIDCGSGAALTELTARTYSAWIMPKTWGKAKEGRIVSLGLQNSFGIKDKNRGLLFRKQFSQTNGLWSSSEASIELGKWQFVAVAYDPGSRKPPKFYVNGVESPGALIQEPAGEIAPETLMPFTIGADAGDTRNFDGMISNVRVYNRVLTAIEIERLAQEPNYRLVFAE